MKLSVQKHTDRDGCPSKKIVIDRGADAPITIKLGSTEAQALAASLKPNGRCITLNG